MKIQQIRQLLEEYESTWTLRKFFLGDHDEASKLKLFLKEFENEHDDYVFSALDVLKLLKTVSFESNLKLIQEIKNQLNVNYFLEIFNTINGAGLINEKNFTLIYGFSYQDRALLYHLFCWPQSERLPLKPEILDTVLAVTSLRNTCNEHIEECFKFLNSRKQLTPIGLDLIYKKRDEAFYLLKILQKLDQAECINDDCLKYFIDLKSLYLIDELLSVLHRSKFHLNENLIRLICMNKNIYLLVEFLSILLDAKYCVDIQTFMMLLKQDYPFFLEKNSVLKILKHHEMINDKIFSYVCDCDTYLFNQILQILEKKELLAQNKRLVIKLIDKKLDSFRLYRVLNYLSKANLLNQQSLDSCVKIISILPKRLEYSRYLFNLFELLNDAHFYMNQENLNTLLTLSDANMERLHGVISGLITSKLLDQNSFEKAFQRVTQKLPAVLISHVTKNSRKKLKAARSEIVLDDQIKLFKAHDKKNYESGGYGIVKKCFNSLTSSEPLYGSKKLLISDHINAQQEAIREVKYHRLLGRQAFYCTNQDKDNKTKTKVVFEWQKEKSLYQFEAVELSSQPMVNRLKCLRSGLSDLNTLHQHYRVHGDLKCQNVILDLKNTTLKLIDFGSAHKKGSSKCFASTASYHDPNNREDHFCRDIYAMGIVAMHLFPEIYTVQFEFGHLKIVFKKSSFSIHEQAVINLINAMMHPNMNMRCTSEDALAYCHEIINHFRDLDQARLDKIGNTTILRSNTTVEDVLRDTKRSFIK